MEKHKIASWSETRWLVLSSLSFLIPSVYAYTLGINLCSVLLLGTTFFSVNYWRNAEKGWRRNADLIYAKISFYTFVLLGIIYVRDLTYIITGYCGLFALVYCYQMSRYTHETKGSNSEWYLYHMLFHLLMTCEMIIILNCMGKTET